MAVALDNRVGLYSDTGDISFPSIPEDHNGDYVTSISFSSAEGRRSILAVGRASGHLCLWSTFDKEVRFGFDFPFPITCVAFKHTTTRRRSTTVPGIELPVEDLAVGDRYGFVWYFSVEWPDYASGEDEWQESVTLIAKIDAHKLQICSLTWSPDGKYLATGGNDNFCQLFELDEILHYHDDPVFRWSAPPSYQPLRGHQPTKALSRESISTRLSRLLDGFRRSTPAQLSSTESVRSSSLSSTETDSDVGTVLLGDKPGLFIPWDSQKHRFSHCGAVKAIAFSPWQPTLLATGGGLNDRTVYFYHTSSGSCLATIHVFAQVTSLIWSTTRREIAVTLGFAQPEHPFRIGVFAWPSCEQIAAIPWDISPYGSLDHHFDIGRSLWAIRVPGNSQAHESIFFSCGRNSSEDETDLVDPGPSIYRHDSLDIAARRKRNRTARCRVANEGCIVVATSDETLRFYQIWDDTTKGVMKSRGLLGYSAILETLEGIENPGKEVIR